MHNRTPAFPSLVAKNDAAHYGVLLLWTLALFGSMGAYYLMQSGSARWIGWACVFNCVVLALGLGAKWADLRTQIRIDANGVFDRAHGVGVIPWDAILGADIVARSDKNLYVYLQLVDTDAWVAKLSPFRRFSARFGEYLGIEPFHVRTTGRDVDAKQLCALIQANCGRSRVSRKLDQV